MLHHSMPEIFIEEKITVKEKAQSYTVRDEFKLLPETAHGV